LHHGQKSKHNQITGLPGRARNEVKLLSALFRIA
jgi:hypothetical protein